VGEGGPECSCRALPLTFQIDQEVRSLSPTLTFHNEHSFLKDVHQQGSKPPDGAHPPFFAERRSASV
jgi:hypothetical protein